MNSSIIIQNASTHECIPDEQLMIHWAESVLIHQDAHGELTIRIIDTPEMVDLNQKYRQKPKPTNVLSFPFENPPGLNLGIIGDIAICAAVVDAEAKIQAKSLQAHWAHMIVHGILHCLGYDHVTKSLAEVMEPIEIDLLLEFGFNNPYGEITNDEQR